MIKNLRFEGLSFTVGDVEYDEPWGSTDSQAVADSVDTNQQVLKINISLPIASISGP